MMSLLLVTGSVTKYLAILRGMHRWEVSWNHVARRSQSKYPIMIRGRSDGQKMAKSAGRFLILHVILPDRSTVYSMFHIRSK